MSLRMFELTDKVAIVTGSGRGIGKAIAMGYADAGANVVVCARTLAEIEASAAEIRTKGRRALAVPTDVRNADEIAQLVEKTLNEFGKIDILVNNVGTTFMAPFLAISERGWDALIRENLKPVYLCTQAVVKAMVEWKIPGCIINISSVLGQGASPGTSAYGAAKAGIIQLTQTLAQELVFYNIRVNCIAPGLIDTGSSQQLFSERPDLMNAQIGVIGMRRLGRADEIVGAAIYLASEAASYVTGQTITISGGFLAQTLKMAEETIKYKP